MSICSVLYYWIKVPSSTSASTLNPTASMTFRPFLVLVEHSQLPLKYFVDEHSRNTAWNRLPQHQRSFSSSYSSFSSSSSSSSSAASRRRRRSTNALQQQGCAPVDYVINIQGNRENIKRCNPKGSCESNTLARAYALSRVQWTGDHYCPCCVPDRWASLKRRDKRHTKMEATYKIVVDGCMCSIVQCRQRNPEMLTQFRKS